MKKITFLIITAFFCLNTCLAQDMQKQMILMKMLGLKTALIQKDSAGLSRLLGDEVSYGHSNAMIQTKAQLIRDVMSGVQEYKSIEPSDMQIRVYENTGIVTMKSKVSMVMQGKPLDISMNVLLVWVWNGSDWKLVARQSVKNI